MDLGKNSSFLAVVSHIAVGGLLTSLLMLHHLSPLVSGAIVAGFAIGKEVSEAEGVDFWEPKQDWLSSILDMVEFFAGIGLVLLLK